MNTKTRPAPALHPLLAAACLLGALALTSPGIARAHCDTLDGPVVKAAQKALASGDPAPVLIWVQAQDESEIREAFQRTLAVRKLSPEARALADTWFFETLVRVHRAGEGAPFTGIKPAGTDLGPAIPAADRALESGDVEPLVQLITEKARTGLRERFERARAARAFAPGDVAAGREYIEAYVPFIHYVERLYTDATTGAAHHFPEAEAATHPEEGGPQR
jgi:hypothetical protein